jgi:hypothetical protein
MVSRRGPTDTPRARLEPAPAHQRRQKFGVDFVELQD